MSPKIDFTTLNKVASVGQYVATINYDADNSAYTPTQDGFIIGNCIMNVNVEGYCFLHNTAKNVYIGGIVHNPALSTSMQILVNVPVKAGEQILFRISGGRFDGGFYKADCS